MFHCCSDPEVANYKSGWKHHAGQDYCANWDGQTSMNKLYFGLFTILRAAKTAVYSRTVWRNWNSFGKQMTLWIISYIYIHIEQHVCVLFLTSKIKRLETFKTALIAGSSTYPAFVELLFHFIVWNLIGSLFSRVYLRLRSIAVSGSLSRW